MAEILSGHNLKKRHVCIGIQTKHPSEILMFWRLCIYFYIYMCVYWFQEPFRFQDYQAFKNELQRIWFDPYKRSRTSTHNDSSGFEHVFLGEITQRKQGRCVSGLHNWMRMWEEETNRNFRLAEDAHYRANGVRKLMQNNHNKSKLPRTFYHKINWCWFYSCNSKNRLRRLLLLLLISLLMEEWLRISHLRCKKHKLKKHVFLF